ncbi:RHS repeat-associated core domain-containing protein [Streptomyces sp. NPDC101160]|uniref:RHS repeat-associated core domain-containing protein n=1 Tax=Streptomyces sp. NPDC101160 TaxID=3366118 RepID=UPI00380637F0
MVTRRRQDPYGNPRGAAPTAWPGEKGFVGGTLDTQTGLTYVGARAYDPSLGKFLSVDPVMDPQDPAQMNAYSYAHNSPITQSDPTGLRPDGPAGGASYNDERWADDRGMSIHYDYGKGDFDIRPKSDSASREKYRRYRSNPANYKVYHYNAKVVEAQRAKAEKERLEREIAERDRRQESERGGLWGAIKSGLKSTGEFLNAHRTTILGVASIFVPALIPLAMASAAADAYVDFSKGDWVSGTLDLVGVAGGGVALKLGRAVYAGEAAQSALQSVTRASVKLGRNQFHALRAGLGRAVSVGERAGRYDRINTAVGLAATTMYEVRAWRANCGPVPSGC